MAALLAPHAHRESCFKPYTTLDLGNQLQVSYTVTPKIVDGMYLRKCTWWFPPGRHPALRWQFLGGATLCYHMSAAAAYPRTAMASPEQQHAAMLTRVLEGCFRYSRRAVSVHPPLCRTGLGRCASCATDFRIAEQGDGALTLTAWQCLGEEGSVYDACWRAMAWDPRERSAADHTRYNWTGRLRRMTARDAYNGYMCPHPPEGSVLCTCEDR